MERAHNLVCASARKDTMEKPVMRQNVTKYRAKMANVSRRTRAIALTDGAERPATFRIALQAAFTAIALHRRRASVTLVIQGPAAISQIVHLIANTAHVYGQMFVRVRKGGSAFTVTTHLCYQAILAMLQRRSTPLTTTHLLTAPPSPGFRMYA